MTAPAVPLRGSLPASQVAATRRRTRRIGSGLWLPTLVLSVWEVAGRGGYIPRNWLPPPSVVWSELVDLGARGELVRHVVATSVRVALGFVFGAVVATLTGVATGRSAKVRSLLDPTLQALRSIPSLAWVPLFLLWLGIGEESKVALIAVGAFFPVYLNLESGIRATDPRLVEVGVLHGYRGWALARRVLIPAALPAYITGLRSGLGLAWMFVVAAELLGASRGLGYLMLDGQATSRPELVLAAILLFAVFGKLSDWGVERVGTLVQPWRSS